MFRFIRNFFFPQSETERPSQEQVAPIQRPTLTHRNSEVVLVHHSGSESSRKRKAFEENLGSTIDSKRNRLSTENRGTWNLDIEQADFNFSKNTLEIFAGTGNTSLISRQSLPSQLRQGQSFNRHQHLSIAACSASSASSGNRQRQRRSQQNSHSALNAVQSVLGQITNLPDSYLSAANSPSPAGANQASTTDKSQPPASTASIVAQATSQQQQQSQKQPCIHSTPLATVATGMASSGARSDKSNKKKHPAAAASTLPKSAAADSADDDEDCVITSIEEPKSVADIISPCKYLSPDWLNDIKTSSQSLKSYMQRVETEENLKMQYWAKRREADERDLVARVTRNLKLAERELPVLPYQYEEPPPTPPPPADEEEEEFPDLTEAQLQLVERAWSRQLPSSEVLAEGFSLRVTREELRSLAGLNWLNDNIVNFYMQLIAARSADEQLGLPKVHAFSTFFYTKLSSSGYASVRRWTRKVDIFSCDILLCPVHLHNNHWTLCIVDLRCRNIIYLDSLSMGGGASCLPLMRQYLADEHRDKKSGAELPDLSDYQLIRETGAPQQENGSDCGVFTCKFADYYCKQKDFTFSQDNMPYFRKRITVEIMEKRLLW
ncbi:hypothetical protein BOX15_Mlig008901g1 [Macrostomum lignano]|uniref:Ubiquitin-like protease family profile domain-containing protein n=1 Tax=Macrostomum lignano TaxID=282301 RepID=A0A267EX45_9PLAT|nr:hypothetical protein BOX15_Mlig008901g1 [Macrostomum lignano]